MLTPPRCWRIVDPINIEWTPRIWADKGLNELLKLKRGEPSPLKTLICFNNPESSAQIEASLPLAAERWRRPGETPARGGAGGFAGSMCACVCAQGAQARAPGRWLLYMHARGRHLHSEANVKTLSRAQRLYLIHHLLTQCE